MDSGNSGSLQSSSGEEEEYESRAAAGDCFSGFMSQAPALQPAPLPQQPPFDPLSNYLHLQNSSSLSPSMFWPRNSDFGPDSYNGSGNVDISTFMSTFQAPTADGSSAAPPSSAGDNRSTQALAARNPKKRSRASRRAPTTVLTTDTSNFRAMVQEFTGIPASPFNSSSPFQRSRLDLFTAPLTNHPSPSYLRRPFSQDVQSSPFLATSVSAPSSSANSPTPLNYQNSNLFSIANPNITPFLHTNHKFPFSSSVLSPKIDPYRIPEIEQNLKNRAFNEFSPTQPCINTGAALSGLSNLVPSDQIPPRNDHDNGSSNDASWRNAVVSPIVNGEYGFSKNSRNGDVSNYLASSSNFEEAKGQENSGTRSEGMIEPWICSSE